jgi:hypothetical protein
MRRWVISALLGAACFGALLTSYRSMANEQSALARYVPSGALLYLEAKDFSALLSDWNQSSEKAQWLRSADYEVFSRSRLFSRLQQASQEFTAAAGLPPDMNLVSQVAGSQSALALYDIGKLQFLYITKLDSSKAGQSALLQSRSKFETRSAGGVTFYYRQDAKSGREVAFAATNGYLLLATREDLMAGSLELLAGSKAPSLTEDGWWGRAVAAASQPGDLRMVLNMDKIVPSPYFRSYWIQQNITAMKAYSAAVSDLYFSGAEYREQRVLLKKTVDATASPVDLSGQGAAELERLVPEDASVYQIQASPSADLCLELLETKLLAPHTGPGVAPNIAPQVELSSGATGAAGDLETRIDQPPPETPTQAARPDSLKALLAGNPVLAVLSVQRTDLAPDGAFVRFQTGVVLLGSSDWNRPAALSVITSFVRPMLTASALGVNWKPSAGYEELDGLWKLSAALRGKYLLLADDPRLLEEMLSNLNAKAGAPPAVFIAAFNHSGEQARFALLTSTLDGQNVPWSRDSGRSPSFFSGNIASLSSVFSGLSSEKVVVRDTGDKVLQTVTYQWAK